MADKRGSLKIDPILDGELALESTDRKVLKSFLVDLFLRYGLQNADAIIDAWKREGTARVRRRRSAPIPLRRAADAGDSEP